MLAGSAALAAGQLLVTPSVSQVHHVTPYQIEGPFFPGSRGYDTDVDLTVIKGRSESAKGEVVYLKGRILDVLGQPLRGAKINMWQANMWGRYDHPNDKSGTQLDPNFQGSTVIYTGDDGAYSVKTIIPGNYLSNSSGTRASHVHFFVQRRGYKALTTQMYFKGDLLIESDRVIDDVPEFLRELLIVDFGAGFGTFDMVLATR